MDIGLFYFAAGEALPGTNPYELLLAGARHADRHDLSAVWTPERHFGAFGGPYANPALTSAAVAAVTERVAIRAGSLIAPLHHPVRIVEDWSMLDQLSGGRIGLCFAPGAQAAEFQLAGAHHADRHALMHERVGQVRRLWAGEPWRQDGLEVWPRPGSVQRDLPLWFACGGGPESFEAAGRAGAGVLTHLMGQTREQLEVNLRRYRDAFRSEAPDGAEPRRPRTALMLHTHVADTDDEAVRVASEPLAAYLGGAMSMFAGGAVDPLDARTRLAIGPAHRRFTGEDGLIGSPETCSRRLSEWSELGVDEIAALVDFGIADRTALDGLDGLVESSRLTREGALR